MKKSLLFALSALVLTTSCVDSLDDYNVDPKSARVGTAPGATFVSNAERNLVRTLNSANINTNPFRLYVQYWAATDYPQETRYEINTRNINGVYWNALYRDVLRDLREAKTNIEADLLLTPAVKARQTACAEVLEIFTWATLVETFGNIPYTQALDISNPLPAYDDQATIYADLIERLDTVIGQLTPGTGLGDADLINDGDMDLWLKFAYSLKLRMALTIADVNDAQARTMVASTVGKTLASNEDNIDLEFDATFPNTNPLYEDLVRSGRNDFVGTNFFINQLKSLTDPRLNDYFNLPTLSGSTEYVGGVYGSSNTYRNFSAPGTILRQQTTPGVVMSYAQVEFMLAEAAARGYIAEPVEEHYNAAITASIQEWGGTEEEATAYLAQPSVAYATAPGVSYKEKIGNQKWIALYNQPTEAYKEWRRLDAPTLTKPATANSEIPVRLPYPIAEQNVNTANFNTAASAIGGDLVTTKLFWDEF